ncbi:hypothetical protein NO1_0183 [Candidatus Termititenax aidoneus]|uniref:FlgD/Vpr Ig-like domain-containing protein n=1 Tax=Termititenax aidoneus TaxID=2218524 RepID=A0A388T7R8_TERA1|nr:hypothetical protein NO1_0183 [Candidatus Termititenax aidoneus]
MDKQSVAYPVLIQDSLDIYESAQMFNIGKDTLPPTVLLARPADSSTYARNYPYYFSVMDNVWTTINVKVYRGAELLLDETQATSDIVAIVPLNLGQNELSFVFTDGAGNYKTMAKDIKLENIAHYDSLTGIYVEIPVGAYNIDTPVLLAKYDLAELVNADWQAGHLPYSIAKFSTPSFVAAFDSVKLAAPLGAWTTLNVPAKFAVKVPKTENNDQKIQPVIWNNVDKKWLAHTAKRLTPEEFGLLTVPESVFALGADEELIYFESPALGLISLMLFETAERPQIKLANADGYYAAGQNQVLFTVKGNYLCLDKTILFLNDVTLNARLDLDRYMDNALRAQMLETVQDTQNALIQYDPEQKIFAAAVEGFVQGDNRLRIDAENLVHSVSAYYTLAVDTGELQAKDIYAYPNPARSAGDQMVRFSCMLSKPADINIRIYTNQGHLIKELNQRGDTGFNAVSWDGKDNYNNQTANGMYLYVITIDDGEKKIIQRKKVGLLL